MDKMDIYAGVIENKRLDQENILPAVVRAKAEYQNFCTVCTT